MLSLTQSPCVMIEGIVRATSTNTPSLLKEVEGTQSEEDEEAVSPVKPVESDADEGPEEAEEWLVVQQEQIKPTRASTERPSVANQSLDTPLQPSRYTNQTANSPVGVDVVAAQHQQKPLTRSRRRKSDEDHNGVGATSPGLQQMVVDAHLERRQSGVRRSFGSRDDAGQSHTPFDVENTGLEGPNKKVRKMQALAPAPADDVVQPKRKSSGKKKVVKRP